MGGHEKGRRVLVVRTPLRVSLFGGGTDFPSYYREYGGCVLSAAINKYIFVIIRKRMDEKIRTGYTQLQTCNSVDEVNHELVREAMRLTKMSCGVEIVTVGDVPAGTGLGSSSTVTVGLLKAMYTYLGEDVSTERLAAEACMIERNILNKPIGVQDQYIASYGGFRFMEFNDKEVSVKDVGINNDVVKELQKRLMLFFTGETREASDVLEEQKSNVSNNTVTLEQLKRHAREAVNALVSGNLDRIGSLLEQTWAYKRELARNISNDGIDSLYKRAREAGALGGKITGAGGGGFLLLYVPSDKQDSVRKELSDLIELPFSFEPKGSRVIYES